MSVIRMSYENVSREANQHASQSPTWSTGTDENVAWLIPRYSSKPTLLTSSNSLSGVSIIE